MDLATLIGLIAGMVVVAAAVLIGSSASVFINVPSLLIVLGGTMAVTLMKFSIADCLFALRLGLRQAFFDDAINSRELVERIKALATRARRDGLLALEDEEIRNEFFRKGVQLCVDGQPPDFVRKVLSNEMDYSIERHELGERIFRGIAEAAPAFGMIGTLVGLVQMLSSMSDPGSIGPAMAVALLTTLYGALIANLVAAPIADKLRMRYQYDRLTKTLLIEGVAAIANGDNAMVIDELLGAYLQDSRPGGQAPAEAGAST
ncbi:MAG: MotA/TolQ/ExbB proton channel family protein [Gammaproteobacteria bacterium]|nr:MotA/TolQ/ExbB proton channel family protein [Gammaproteobacteria bacterium]